MGKKKPKGTRKKSGGTFEQLPEKDKKMALTINVPEGLVDPFKNVIMMTGVEAEVTADGKIHIQWEDGTGEQNEVSQFEEDLVRFINVDLPRAIVKLDYLRQMGVDRKPRKLKTQKRCDLSAAMKSFIVQDEV